MKPTQIIDLTLVLEHSMPGWPTQPAFQYERTHNVPRDNVTLHVIRRMTLHTGTHIDTPLHFLSHGRSVDQFPIETFAGFGVVLNLSDKEAGEPILVDDLTPFQDQIRPGDVVMIHTGWDTRVSFTPEYLFEYPYLVEATAAYLVGRGIKALGVDTLSVGGWDEHVPGHGPTAPAGSNRATHRCLLAAEIILIEALCNLGRVLDGASTRRAYFLYAPLTIRGAEGGPCRAIAFLDGSARRLPSE
jgi:arylformamidase